MGYSLSVALPDPAARDRMLAFLQAQDWTGLQAAVDQDALASSARLAVVGGEDLSYSPRQTDPACLLGFNGTAIPHAAWAVVAWVATKAGTPGRPAPLWHDSERLRCVVDDNPDLDTRRFQVDSQGVFVLKPDKDPWPARLASALAGRRQARRDEQAWMRQLNDAWNATLAVDAPKANGPRP